MQLSVDLVETDDSFNLYADVPGLSKSDLKVCNLAFIVILVCILLYCSAISCVSYESLTYLLHVEFV